MRIEILNDNKNKANLIKEFKKKYFDSTKFILNQNIQVKNIEQYINYSILFYHLPIDKLEPKIKLYLKEFIIKLLIYRISLKSDYNILQYDQNFTDLLARVLKESTLEESKEILALFKGNYFTDPYFTTSIFQSLIHRLISYFEPLSVENIEKWKYFANLALEESTNSKFNLRNHLSLGEENLLSLIIFVYHDLTNFMVFFKKGWTHINNFIDIIDEWVKTFGVNPRFYRYFSKCVSHFIDEIDYQKILEWLNYIVENNINKDEFLRSESNNLDTMFILMKIWSKNKNNIIKNKPMLEIFSKLINLYSNLGIESANNIFYELESL